MPLILVHPMVCLTLALPNHSPSNNESYLKVMVLVIIFSPLPPHALVVPIPLVTCMTTPLISLPLRMITHHPNVHSWMDLNHSICPPLLWIPLLLSLLWILMSLRLGQHLTCYPLLVLFLPLMMTSSTPSTSKSSHHPVCAHSFHLRLTSTSHRPLCPLAVHTPTVTLLLIRIFGRPSPTSSTRLDGQ